MSEQQAEEHKDNQDKTLSVPEETAITEQSEDDDEKEKIELPPQLKEAFPQLKEALLVQIRREYSKFSGPLPPPELLKEYNEVVPGCAEIIIDQFVEQSKHR